MTAKPAPPVNSMNNDAAAIATLNIRVTGIEGRVSELSNTVNGVQTALSSKIDTLATALSSKIEERGKTPWAIYLSGLMAVFSLYAYIDNSKIGPLKERDQDLIASVKEISNIIRTEMVPARVHAREWAQNDERFQRFEERVKFTEGSIVERVKRIEDQFNSAYNLRDALQQLDSRVQHFERMSTMKAP